MFEKELALKFAQIFEVKKVRFDAPGESQEQGCIFIEVENAKNTIKDGYAKSMVTGNAIMFSQSTELKFGFFAKAIQQANPQLTKDLFFYDIEVNTPRYQNIVQRGFSFVYFYGGQYDPDTGSITTIEFEITEE